MDLTDQSHGVAQAVLPLEALGEAPFLLKVMERDFQTG